MDSRTKFYGPVLAMLSLSAVAFNGFVTPPLEIEEPAPESEDRQEEVQSTTQSPEQGSTDNLDAAATTGEDSLEGDPASNPISPETNPEPVTFLDWLFIPIPDESAQTPDSE
ncbi:MAG: hypothetical protein AB4050_08720 [Synechococcus sp.]